MVLFAKSILPTEPSQFRKIAQVASLWERVPPSNYGGIELVVSHLTDQLVRRGHEVILFASGNSPTLAKLKVVFPRALRLDRNVPEYAVYEILELSQVYQNATGFDIIHSHVGIGALPLASLGTTPTVHNLHSSFTKDSQKVLSHHHQQPQVSISNAHHQIHLNYIRTVYNRIEPKNYPFIDQPKQPPYLAFLGRFSLEKETHQAIAIAKQSGWRLKMAGKVDAVDARFFEQDIVPHIDGRQIEYLSAINYTQQAELLGNTAIKLFPINWQKPFGLVMLESIPEVIDQDKTGFICQTYEEMAQIIPAAWEFRSAQL